MASSVYLPAFRMALPLEMGKCRLSTGKEDTNMQLTIMNRIKKNGNPKQFFQTTIIVSSLSLSPASVQTHTTQEVGEAHAEEPNDQVLKISFWHF